MIWKKYWYCILQLKNAIKLNHLADCYVCRVGSSSLRYRWAPTASQRRSAAGSSSRSWRGSTTFTSAALSTSISSHRQDSAPPPPSYTFWQKMFNLLIDRRHSLGTNTLTFFFFLQRCRWRRLIYLGKNVNVRNSHPGKLLCRFCHPGRLDASSTQV